VVVDNATDPQLVRSYLPPTGLTRVIVTSTDRAFTSLGADIDVGVFDRAQSVAYLAKRTGLGDGAAAVAEELADLPLALAQAGSVIKLQNLSYGVYLDRLRALPLDEMLPRDRGDAYPQSVAAAILLSIEAVEEEDHCGQTGRVVSAIAVLADDGVDRGVLALVVGAAVENDRHVLDATLGRLVEASVLVWARDGHAIVMHRLVARTLRDRMQTTGDLFAAITHTSIALRPLFVPENQAWDNRLASTEIVGHSVSLWRHAAHAAESRVLARIVQEAA